MVRYFYAWTPLLIVGTVVFLALPWLGVIALMVIALVALAALAALAWALVFVPFHMLTRAVNRRRQSRSDASPRTAVALHVSGRPYAYAAPRRIDYRTPQIERATDLMSVGAHDGAASRRTLQKEHVS